MTNRLQKELEIACTAVQHCAILTRKLQQQTLGSDSSVSKSDFSPVTIGDFAVQALLTSAIHDAFPQANFLAEESADELRQNDALLDRVWQLVESVRPHFSASTPPLKAPGSKDELLDLLDLGGKNTSSAEGWLWVFDPIDGTATFMKDQQYAINCALLLDGREELGILGCPRIRSPESDLSDTKTNDEGYGYEIFAVRGEGTHVRPMQVGGDLKSASRLSRHGDNTSVEDLIWSDCTSYTSTILPLHQQVAKKLNTAWPGVDLYSSLMKYASLALARSHIVIRIFKYASWRSNMWDHTGGVLIFEEAGGKVTDLNGNPIDFRCGRKMSENYGLVCAPSSVHAQVLAIVQEVIKAHGPIPWSK